MTTKLPVPPSGFPTLFSFTNMEKEISYARKVVFQGRLNRKIRALWALGDIESRLTGLYLEQSWVKQRMGFRYEHNVLLANALGNQSYVTLSTTVLLNHGFYGSARTVLRQFFEGLLLAKFSEMDGSLSQKWASYTEQSPAWEGPKLERDVFQKLPSHVDPAPLRRLWRELNLFTHPTKYAQQPPRLLDMSSKRSQKIGSALYYPELHAACEQTADYLYVMQAMHFHLLTAHLGVKASRWWFGSRKDPIGAWRLERSLKSRWRLASQKYLSLNDEVKKELNATLVKPPIREYRKSWKPKVRVGKETLGEEQPHSDK